MSNLVGNPSFLASQLICCKVFLADVYVRILNLNIVILRLSILLRRLPIGTQSALINLKTGHYDYYGREFLQTSSLSTTSCVFILDRSVD